MRIETVVGLWSGILPGSCSFLLLPILYFHQFLQQRRQFFFYARLQSSLIGLLGIEYRNRASSHGRHPQHFGRGKANILFAKLQTLVDCLELPHLCLLELKHQQLTPIFYEFLLECSKNIDRATQVPQKDLLLASTEKGRDVLEDSPHLILGGSLYLKHFLGVSWKLEEHTHFWKTSAVQLYHMHYRFLLQL